MKRRYALAAVAVASVAAAFVSGASVPAERAKPADETKPDGPKPTVVVVHKTAVFNMAAVMRDFHLAKYRVWVLNNKKTELSKKMLGWREEYVQLQKDVQKDQPQFDKDDKTKKMLELARKIEDADRKINKQLNDDASAIIADLYDKMKTVVDRTAEEHGFQLVLAYPDAVTPDELNSPYIKELKLKPPAAQPFYVARDIDLTARVVAALNERFPPIDPETKEPVDVSKLEAPVAPSAPPVPLPPLPGAPDAAPRSGAAPVLFPPVPKVRP